MDGQLYIDAPLTSFSQQYRNEPEGFIQDVVAPVVLVEKKTGKYAYYPKSNLKAPVNSIRTGEGKTARANFQVQWKSYTELNEHALKDGITKDEYAMYQDPLDPQQDTVAYLMDQLQLEREIELNTVITKQMKYITLHFNGLLDRIGFDEMKLLISAIITVILTIVLKS